MGIELIQNIQQLWKRSSTVKNISKVYVGNIVSTGIVFITALILIRGLSVTDYAFIVAFTSLALLTSGVVGNGINSAMVRYSAERLSINGEKPLALYLSALIVEVIIFFILIIFVAFFPSNFSFVVLGNTMFSRSVLVGVFYGLGLLLLQFGRGIYQAEQKFNLYIVSMWLRQGLILILILGLWIFGRLTFETAAWTTAGISIVIGSGVVFYGIGSDNAVPSPRSIWRERILLRQFFESAGWLVGYYLCLSLLLQLDVIMLSRYSTGQDVAIYGVAYKYYSTALLLLASINAVLLPKFSQISMQDRTAQSNFLKKWIRYSVWLIIPILFIVFIGRRPFIWLNGVNYESSFNIFVIFAFGIWISLTLSPLANILISRKEFRFMFALGVSALIFTIIGNYILVQMWQGIGAAIVVVLANNIIIQIPILWRVLK